MTEQASPSRYAVQHGDCIDILKSFKSARVDFVLTDPPYLVRYQSRDGKRVHNDDNAAWLELAFTQSPPTVNSSSDLSVERQFRTVERAA